MKFNVHPNVTVLDICDAHLLVASREAWQDCPRIRPIPKSWAGFLKVMECGKTSEETIAFYRDVLRFPEEKLRSKFEPMLQSLLNDGYLIPLEEEE